MQHAMCVPYRSSRKTSAIVPTFTEQSAMPCSDVGGSEFLQVQCADVGSYLVAD